MTKMIHGGDWAGYQTEYGGMPLDFSASISPLGLPGPVRRAICRALDHADRYPDPLCRELCGKLGAYHSIPTGWVLCGNGAADLIYRLALAARPKRVLIPAPTFAEYEQALCLTGCGVDHVFLKEEQSFAVTGEILNYITPGLDLVVFCNPNNPTGLTVDSVLLGQILDRCAANGTLLVVDECFNEFLPEPAVHTLVNELADHPNLLLLRAFTKWYGMAGVRLGYALCSNMGLLAAMRACGQPWAVSTLAQAAGIAALGADEYSKALHALIAGQRPNLQRGLTALGCRVVPGQANYLLFFCPVPNLAEKLSAKGILLRDCANFAGLGPGWYRAAVRTGAENRTFLQAMREVLENG